MDQMGREGLWTWAVLFLVLSCSCFSAVTGQAEDPATYFNITSFNDVALQGSGAATVSNGALVLNTQSPISTTGGSAWYPFPVQVLGFSVSFTFNITNFLNRPDQRPDGIAFVIMNSEQLSVVGPLGSGLGYGWIPGSPPGLPATVAVEIDTWYNPELLDPDATHVSIHSLGLNSNNASEANRIGLPPNNIFTLPSNFLLDTLDVTISYDPSKAGGTFTVAINDQSHFVVQNISLQDYLQLDATSSSIIGFTSGSHRSTAGSAELFTVSQWSYQYTGQVAAANSVVTGIDSTIAGRYLSFSVQAFDQFNLAMSTDGVGAMNYALWATLVQPDGSTQNATAVYLGLGLYNITINATLSGNATVNVWLNGTAVGHGSYGLVVIPAEPYAANSYPFGFTPGVDSVAVAGEPITFFVQLQDVFGNNITTDQGAILSATVSPIPSTSYALVIGYDPSLSYYRGTFNITLEGNFTIVVQLNGAAIGDSTRMVQVVPASVDPATSELYNVSEIAVAGVLQFASVQLKDVFSNNASNANVDFFIHLSQNNVRVNGSVFSCTRGLCVIAYNLTLASYDTAVYSVLVEVNEVPIKYSLLATVQVIPAALSESVSYIYGTGIAQGRAGDLTVFYLQLTDVFGNNRSEPTASIAPTLTTAPALNIVPNLTYVSDRGYYTYQYNATVATVYTLTVLVNAIPVTNGINNVTISPAAVFPPNCYGFGAGLAGDQVAGLVNLFYVQLRDLYNNNISYSGSESVVVAINGAVQTNGAVVFNAGYYEVSYNLTLAGNYSLSITVDGVPILNAGQSITLIPNAIYPLECVATNVGLTVVAGELSQFQVQLRDVYANNIANVPSPDGIVTATLSGLAVATVDVAYAGLGQYVLSYNATASGAYTLTILVFGTAINGGGQYAVQITPAPAYQPFCLTEGQATQSAVAGDLSVFLVYLFDVFNNSIINANPDDVPVGSIDEQLIDVEFNSTLGAFEVSYNITQSAVYTLAVTVRNTSISDTVLTVSPAPLYESNSFANGSALLAATAGDVGVIYIYQRDQYGNMIEEYSQVQTVAVTMTNGETQATLPPVAQSGNGGYSQNYNITVAGNYITTITINGVNILGSPFATGISAAPFDPHGTVTDGLALLVTAGVLNNFTILLKDVYGNDVSDSSMPNPVRPDDVSVLLNGKAIPIDPVLISNTSAFLVSYNVTLAGPYNMNVTINNTDVGTAPIGILTVQPNVVYPLACTVSGDAASEAIVKRDNSFLLYVRDRFNNTRDAPVAPKITLTAQGLNIIYGSIANNSDGTYTVTYFVEEKTVYTMFITFDGDHIQGSPFTVNANYGNSSPPTLIIVCAVVGSVVAIGLGIGGYLVWKRRRMGFVSLE